MEKKRSIGVTLFGFSLLYFPIMEIFKFVYLCLSSYRLREILRPSPLRFFYPSPLVQLLLFTIFLTLSIGIIKLKRQVYYPLIVVAFFAIVAEVYSLIKIFTNIPAGGSFDPISIAEPILISIYFVSLLVFSILIKSEREFSNSTAQ